LGGIVVVSGPSGVGKGTLIAALRRRMENVRVTISDTTRSPRSGEIDGVNYNFISIPEFKRRIDTDHYVEWEYFFETYYGTPKPELENIKSDDFVVLELDPKGALSIKRSHQYATLLFILPGSIEQLNRQLAMRGTETTAERAVRTARLIEELDLAKQFDFAMVNRELDMAIDDFCSIFSFLRFGTANQHDFIAELRKKAGDALNGLY
jgi:guanylate kinase